MDAKRRAREERKRKLLKELAEINVEELAESGGLDGRSHFGGIERAAREMGRELSRETQERAAREAAAHCDPEAACPTCGTFCEVRTEHRRIESIDGPVELVEPVADCRQCRRSFFPSTQGDGTG